MPFNCLTAVIARKGANNRRLMDSTPTPLEECSLIVESFVTSCTGGSLSATDDHDVEGDSGEGSSSYEPMLSPTGSSNSRTSSATPTHQQTTDALLVSQRKRALPSQRRTIIEVFEYPYREISAAAQFLTLLRHSIATLLETLVGSSESTEAASSAPSAANTATVPGSQGAEFLQLGHRTERLELLGRRIQMLFVDKLVPSITDLEELEETLRMDVQQNLNPFGFPSTKDATEDSNNNESFSVSPRKQHHQQLPPSEGLRDIDVVSESALFSHLRIISALPHDGIAASTIRTVVKEFEGIKIGPEGASIGMEGQPFHGQMQEVRHVWKKLVGMLHEFSVMGRILRSAMASQRRHRQTWIRLLETGALDDLCNDVGQEFQREDDDNSPLANPSSARPHLLPESLMRTATTRLQMRRLAMLVGTCRALDSSGAEAAIKKIHFENERRQSAAVATSMSATASINGRRGTSAVVMLASSASVSFPNDASVSHVFDDMKPSQSPTTALEESLDPFATVSSMPIARHLSRKQSRRSSSVVPSMNPSLSIVPPTTLMDLEMIVRAYGLVVPRLTLPAAELLATPSSLLDQHHQTKSPPSLTPLPSTDEGGTSSSKPVVHLGVELEQRLFERRQHRLDVLQKARRALEASSASDPSMLSRQRVLYASNRCDMGIMTTDCIVIQRCDVAAQTQTTGTVFEAATMDDVLGELSDARMALRERTQQLMLERHRSQALLSQLEKLQRQRQDHARRSAAAGSGTLGGAAAGTVSGTPDGDGDVATDAPMSPARCLSPVNSIISDGGGGGDDEGTMHVMNSAVDLLLLRFREQKDRAAMRRVPSSTTPSALERKASAARGARSNSPEQQSSSPPLRRPHSSSGNAPESTSAGPMIKRFKILGRLDRIDSAHHWNDSPHHQRHKTSPVRRPQSPPHVPTAGSHNHHSPSASGGRQVTIVPLQPEDLVIVDRHQAGSQPSPTIVSPATTDVGLPPAVAAARSPATAAAKLPSSRPTSSTLERQFGPIFARKLRSLEHHSNGLVGTVQEEDYWTGKREITAVVVPGGIDPRHGTKLVHKPGEGGGGGVHHTMNLLQGPSAAALTRHALGPSQMKSTHYGTVGAGGRK